MTWPKKLIKTNTKTKTFWEHPLRAILETCDLWDICSEWWEHMTWQKKLPRQIQRQRQRQRQWQRQRLGANKLIIPFWLLACVDATAKVNCVKCKFQSKLNTVRWHSVHCISHTQLVQTTETFYVGNEWGHSGWAWVIQIVDAHNTNSLPESSSAEGDLTIRELVTMLWKVLPAQTLLAKKWALGKPRQNISSWKLLFHGVKWWSY